MSTPSNTGQDESVQVISGSLSVKISDADIFRLVQAFGVEPSDEDATNSRKKES